MWLIRQFKTLEALWLIFMSACSLTLGVLYSIHNTDSHHWGFICGTALDYIQGKQFFRDIYIQYGVGESLLFKALNPFIPINFTSIGVLTSIAYCINLLLIYLNLKKISNGTLALILSVCVFLLNPYAIVPWPDYWAGLMLSAACFFLLHEGRSATRASVIAGIFLFLGFIFRYTYGLSFALAGISFWVFTLFKKDLRSKKIHVCLMVFLSLSGVYLLSLMQDQTFRLWYAQSIGAASSQYSIGNEAVMGLLKKIFLPHKVYLPNNQITTTMSVLFWLGLYSLYLLLFRVKKSKTTRNHFNSSALLFVVLLGLAGILQEMLIFEIFRFQNSCSPLYLIFAFLIILKFPDIQALLNKKIAQALIAIYIMLLIAKFPHSASWHPVYEGSFDSYSKSNIPLFAGHRFRPDVKKYYDDLFLYLCDGKSKILNLTFDSTIPYLCPGQKNALKIPFFYPPLVKNSNPDQLLEIEQGLFAVDTLIVAENVPPPVQSHLQLVELGKFKRPESIRFWTNLVLVYRVENKAKTH
jgi:hypothetical protein